MRQVGAVGLSAAAWLVGRKERFGGRGRSRARGEARRSWGERSRVKVGAGIEGRVLLGVATVRGCELGGVG